ncbi:MAG: LamG-like jellyroll fold domain-containing protein, partial [Gammaproteobacteria bacterium]|nr:LamG-like jellyroll fold domain-containing protein [Gammaproteobacteria bacterium]
TLAAQSYTLTVNNIQAAPAGPIIAANSTASFFAEGGYLSGLRGSYFANMTLAGSPAGQRVDGPVNFDWANGTPGVAGIGADNFSVRWEGFVTSSATGNYTFRTRSDDGVRLYVNGVLVINNWTDHAATNNDSAPIALTAGQRYPIVMEFYENGGQAVAQLSWSGPDTGGFQFIPRSSLSHFCGLPRPVAFYKMDELSWNGTTGEVADSSGNGLNMTAYGGAVPAPARVCNGAQLNAVSPAPLDRYLEIGHDARFNATTNLTVTAWIRPAEWPSADLMTIASKDTNWEFHINPSGQIFWWWNTGAAALTTSGAAAAPLNTWTHVAIVFAIGQQTIYVNGVSRAAGTDGATLFNNALPLQIGGDQNFAGGGRRFRGAIDEVRIYDATLTQTDIQTIINDTRPCVSSVDHYYVQHATAGINCQAESVSITAHDVAHAPTSADSRVITISADRIAGAAGTRGDWSLVAGTGGLNNGTADDGVASYTFGAGETTVLLAYKNTWVQTVNFSVSDGVASDTSGNANADAGYNQNLSFEPSGFRLVDGNNNLPAQTAGVSGGPFYLQAVQTGTGGCTTPGPCAGVCTVPTGFENGATVAMDLAFRCDNPTTCQAGQQVSIINNGTTAIAGNPAAGVSSYTSKTLLFGADGRAAFNFVYPDVGAISLHVRYDIPLGTGAASGNLMTGSSNSFVVRPYGFVLSNIETTAGAVANPGASDHTGGVFIRAGDDFSATVTSVNFAGNATPNFGREIAPETVRLTSALVAPAAGAAPALANPTAFSSFSNGAATGTTFAWGEVGIITLTPEVGDADYLGAGNVTGAASGNVGRFIPYDFAATRNAPFFEAGCTVPGKDAFTYAGQGFVYQTAPILT